MNEIVGSVQRVSDIIGEITAAAGEQSDGIGQVNVAVTQLDQMTQQNAALVEESAAAAESLKDQAARERLEPLEEGERPLVVTVGAVLSLAIAVSIVVAWLAGVEVQVGNTDIEERPSAFQVFPPAILFAVMGIGMLRARYWAVLGFQALLALCILVVALALTVASNVLTAIICLAIIIPAGTLFWFMVKALARIQMPNRPGAA